MTVTSRPVHRVAVVGGGVLGASTAAALARDGAEVTLFTACGEGTTAASAASFAWVNAHDKSPESYRRLNHDARRRHAELAQPWFHPVGAIADGVESPDDGYVDTHAFIAAHLAELRMAGGIVRTATTFTMLDGLRRENDVVIVAAGAATAGLVRDQPHASDRISTSSGAEGHLARIRVDRHPVNRIISLDGLQLRPDGDGVVAAQSLAVEGSLRERGIAASVDRVWPALRDEISQKLEWDIPRDAAVRIDRAARPSPRTVFPWWGGSARASTSSSRTAA
jgi:FAD dependent oxidoreductase.